MTDGRDKASRPRSDMPDVAADVPHQLKNFLDVGRSQSLLGNAAVADAALNMPSSVSAGLPARSPAPADLVTSELGRTRGNSVVQRVLSFDSVQAKLTVSQPGDAHEREADRVAEQVVSGVARPTVQRQCPVCGDAGTCADCQQKPPAIQPKHKSGASLAIDPQTAAEIVSLRGGGQPLPQGVRDKFEPHFGRDFSAVRIHDDSKAADLADAVGARAFTSQQDIVFGRSQYAPEGVEGQRLLAHELTHVVQQGSAVASPGTVAETVFRQTAVTPGGGPDPCLDLILAIIEFLNDVAQRLNDALNDRHDLFRDHRGTKDAHPEHGSWDGHRDRYNYERDRLRRKIAEWDSNDDCRAFRLSRQQQEDLDEAREFGNKAYPERPSPSMREAPREVGESVWDKLRKYLPEILVGALIAIGAYLVAGAVVACFASGACEFAAVLAGVGFLLVIGISAAMRAAGIQDRGPVASSDDPASDDEERPT